MTIVHVCCRSRFEEEFFDSGMSDRDLISYDFKEGTASSSSDLVSNQVVVHSVVWVLTGTLNSLRVSTAVFVHDLSHSWFDLREDAPSQADIEKLQVVRIGLA